MLTTISCRTLSSFLEIGRIEVLYRREVNLEIITEDVCSNLDGQNSPRTSRTHPLGNMEL